MKKKINKKILIGWSLSIIIVVSLITVITISCCKNKMNKFGDSLRLSVENHIKDNGVETEYKEKENTFFCKRGPIVFKSISELINKNDKGRELLKNLLNWFYENVPWGPEIMYFREIEFKDQALLSDANGIPWEAVTLNKELCFNLSGIKVFLNPFSDGFKKVKEEYLKDNDASKPHPLSSVIDKIQYSLYYVYTKTQMKWFFRDYSSKTRNGGWHVRGAIDSIDLRTEQIYKNRFKKSQTTNWRYPFTTNQLDNFDTNAHKTITLEEVYENANSLDSSTRLWSDKKDLYHLDQTRLKNNNIIELIKNQDNYSTYFNGLDRGENLANKELSVWEADNLLDEFRESWLKPFCREFNININVDGTINADDPATDEQLAQIIEILNLNKNNDNEKFSDLWEKTSKHQFRGYTFNWISEFLKKVVFTIIQVNKKISYNVNQKFVDVLKAYKTFSEKNTSSKQKSNPPIFDIEKKLKDKNDNYIAHPQYPISLGSDIISYFDYCSNLAHGFAARDYLIASMGCNLNNIHDKFENGIASNINNKFWNDVSFLKAFNALPYDQQNTVDEDLLKTLAKVMRIDQDLAMTYKSEKTSLSYMWGYMPEDANYKALVFKNSKETKEFKIHTASYKNQDANDNKQTLDFDHMFYNEKFMDKSSKKSLTRLMKRKAWISDWNLLSDYENAVVPIGEYKVYFKDENGNHIELKNYDSAGLSDYEFKLNSGSDYDCFAQYVFHYDSTAKTMILNVRKLAN